jgi:divalent metal cation (Fe/Co/Zn/Cd) transporter
MAAIDVHPPVKAILTTQIGIWIIIILFFFEASAGYFGHFYILIAGGTETGANVVSSPLPWQALRIAMKPADPQHPYGMEKHSLYLQS